MEDFSTNRHPLVPRVANMATLAVVLAATWWSGAQRPGDAGAVTDALNAPAAAQVRPAGLTRPAPTAEALPARPDASGFTALRTSGSVQVAATLQTVGYQPAKP